MKPVRVFITAALLLVLPACAATIHPPEPATAKTESLTWQQVATLWQRVLHSVVDAQGRINFDRVARMPEALYTVVDYLGQVSPRSHPDRFPSRQHQLAYHLNAYNALALYGVLALKVDEGFESLVDRAKFFALTRHRLGGETISLLKYENEIIRPLGDPRVHFALNCMVVGCPRLPREPFLAETLDAQLDSAAREFVSDTRHVQVLEPLGLVRLSAIFDFYTEDFVNPRVAPSLIDYVNRYRARPIPPQYDFEFLPYDWTLNRK